MHQSNVHDVLREPPWEGTERLIFFFPQILMARLS